LATSQNCIQNVQDATERYGQTLAQGSHTDTKENTHGSICPEAFVAITVENRRLVE
jgi:hypothetical protein